MCKPDYGKTNAVKKHAKRSPPSYRTKNSPLYQPFKADRKNGTFARRAIWHRHPACIPIPEQSGHATHRLTRRFTQWLAARGDDCRGAANAQRTITSLRQGKNRRSQQWTTQARSDGGERSHAITDAPMPSAISSAQSLRNLREKHCQAKRRALGTLHCMQAVTLALIISHASITNKRCDTRS